MTNELNKADTQELLDENPHLGIIDRHAESVSKAKLVLIAICCVAIIVSFIYNTTKFNDVGGQIHKVESPCLRYGSNSKACHESFQAAINSITDYQLCILLAKRPDLTKVEPLDCKRIAREVREQRGDEATRRGAKAARPNARLPLGSGGRPHPAPTAPVHSAHPEHPSSGGTHGGHHPDPAQPSPESSPSPTPSAPQASPTPTSAGSAAAEPSSSGGQTSPASTQPSNPPVVGVEAPGLPIRACAPGVVSVNCG